jgi:hypothetical protein
MRVLMSMRGAQTRRGGDFDGEVVGEGAEEE